MTTHTTERTPSAMAVLETCASLHSEVVAPWNETLRGPLERSERQLFQTALPLVLLLGNHSSGKSSFANFALGRDVQTAGVAPTDDAFTVVAPAPADHDRDGFALVSDPDLGFGGLRAFGPGLVQRLQLKLRSGLATREFMVVDSPGMIDSPGAHPVSMSFAGQHPRDHSAFVGPLARGYDFDGAVRWFAERADVILLFFDPDKPGTTGETLSVLTRSLNGMDHKLHIVLNKADTFERVHDFARAYGALCWNLSKVIPRKDLPRIHTMCVPRSARHTPDNLPVSGRRRRDGADSSPATPTPEGAFFLASLHDLHASRDHVVAEVFKAPSRRVDNAVTRLRDAAFSLLMHAKVCDAAKRRALWRKWVGLYATTGASTLGVVAVVGLYLKGVGALRAGSSTAASAASSADSSASVFSFFFGDHAFSTATSIWLTLLPPAGLGALGLVAVGVAHVLNARRVRSELREDASPHGLDRLYATIYARDLAEGDDDVHATWQRVRANLAKTLDALDGNADALPLPPRRAIRTLQRIVDVDVPDLRRRSAPIDFNLTRRTGRVPMGDATTEPSPPGTATRHIFSGDA